MESTNELTPREQSRLERHLKFAERQRRWPWLMKAAWIAVILIALQFLVWSGWGAFDSYEAFGRASSAGDWLPLLAATNDFWRSVCSATLYLMASLVTIFWLPFLAQSMKDHRLIVKLHARARPAEPTEPDAGHAG